MPATEQDIHDNRYTLIPRTAIFVRCGDSYLLMRGSPTKRLWAGKYNGLGGHVERGEDLLSAAKRELREESGLDADLWLCGTVFVDAGDVGVCLFVFTAESPQNAPRPSPEGIPEWIAYERVASLPAVEDLPELLAHVHRMRRGDAPFAARSFYDEQQRLKIVFTN